MKNQITEFSPETEARLAPLVAARDEQVIRIVNLWTRLRLKQNLPPTVAALNEKINTDWQLLYGLDSLDGVHLDKLEKTLSERITRLDSQLNKGKSLQKA